VPLACGAFEPHKTQGDVCASPLCPFRKARSLTCARYRAGPSTRAFHYFAPMGGQIIRFAPFRRSAKTAIGFFASPTPKFRGWPRPWFFSLGVYPNKYRRARVPDNACHMDKRPTAGFFRPMRYAPSFDEALKLPDRKRRRPGAVCDQPSLCRIATNDAAMANVRFPLNPQGGLVRRSPGPVRVTGYGGCGWSGGAGRYKSSRASWPRRPMHRAAAPHGAIRCLRDPVRIRPRAMPISEAF